MKQRKIYIVYKSKGMTVYDTRYFTNKEIAEKYMYFCKCYNYMGSWIEEKPISESSNL